jgi:hypothetical protein
LADVAARHCAEHIGRERYRYVGRVACGACWERAIRDDERVVIAFGLPRALSTDPVDVDQVAVELACCGERVRLTSAERAEAARQLAGRGVGIAVIGGRLGMSAYSVRAVLDGLADAVPFLPAATEAGTGTDAAVA